MAGKFQGIRYCGALRGGRCGSSSLTSDYYPRFQTAELGQQVYELSDDINLAEKQVNAYQEALNQSADAAEEAKAAAEGYADVMSTLTGDAKEAAEAADGVAASALALSDSLQRDAATGIVEAGAILVSGLGTVSAAYSEAYTTAYDSISGQERMGAGALRPSGARPP